MMVVRKKEKRVDFALTRLMSCSSSQRASGSTLLGISASWVIPFKSISTSSTPVPNVVSVSGA